MDLQPYVAEAGLQPDVEEAATICGGGCNQMWRRLQPYVTEAATVCDGDCNHNKREASTICMMEVVAIYDAN